MLDQFLGKVLADKYRIDSVMRETDLGRIYHGTHLLMEKNVAVKILSPALAVDEKIVDRFSREARAVSKISHPNILNVTDFGSDADGTVFIVFEDADGLTLRKLIANGETFSAERAVLIVRQIASALAAGHMKGLVHRHLTTDNVIVNEDDEIKLLDLGAGNDPADGEYTTDRIRYLSPEQCADPGNGDARSDIYSLGVIFYEMLAGEPPFQGENTSELMLKHAQEPPRPLSAFRRDLPPEIEPVILQALAKNPEMRHQTAVELIDDLNRAARGLASAASAAPKLPAGSPNNIWKTAFIVLAGIALLSAGLIWATSSRQTDPSTFQLDANAMPVQPIGPASGINEQGLSNIAQVPLDFSSNSNMMLTAPDTLSGGTGNPLWDQGYIPPGPVYIPPAGNSMTVGPCDPNNPFMPCDTIVVQQPSNTNVNAQRNPTPKPTPTPAANTVSTPVPTESPKPQTSPTASPAKTATPKPSPTPAKRPESGKTQDG